MGYKSNYEEKCMQFGKENKKMYYNKHEFMKIIKQSQNDPYGAILEFENYFSKYPDDYSLRTYYISTLISVCRFDEAEIEINKLEDNIRNCQDYIFHKEKQKLALRNFNFCKYKLYLYQGRINELIDLYYSDPYMFSFLGKEKLFYLQKLAGKLENVNREHNFYIYRQIIEYMEDDFRTHIKKHMYSFDDNDRKLSASYFNSDFPIDRVVSEIKKYIPSDKRLCYGCMEDTYVFKYDQCGRDYNKMVDYFKVITFSNTADFITMFPSVLCENFPYHDLNYLNEKEEEKILVKRPSQIDKFNRKYNLK